MKIKKIGILVGSLRKESFNRKTANALIQLASQDLHCEIIEIGNLPLYSQDDDENPPLPFKTFREKIKSCDGIIFVTPEYNRSVPGVLKNAIDIGSRPYGQSAWAKKPAGVISVSIGGMGGFGANHHLRQSLVFLDMPALQQPELYIGHASKLFNEQGMLLDDQVKNLLSKFLQSYEQWLNTVSPEQMSLFARKAENASQPRQ
jgi:chromate reductase